MDSARQDSEMRGRLDGSGRRITILASRFNRVIARELVEGARECLLHHGVGPGSIDVVWAPGTLETPLLARAIVQAGRADAIVVVGCVIQGETTHDEVVVREASGALVRLSHESGVPITLGIVHAPSVEAALERAGIKMNGRSWEAAQAALEVLDLLARLRPVPPPATSSVPRSGRPRGRRR